MTYLCVLRLQARYGAEMLLECSRCTPMESSRFTIRREAGHMERPAAGRVSGSEPPTGSPRVLQWVRVAVRVKGSSSQPRSRVRKGRTSEGHVHICALVVEEVA